MGLSRNGILFLGVLLVVITDYPQHVAGRKHNLHLSDDYRRVIHLTQFGFFKGGIMEVTVHDIFLQSVVATGMLNKQIVGFTVDRTLKDGTNPYPQDIESNCALTQSPQDDESTSSILFTLDFASKSVKVKCSPSLVGDVQIYESASFIPVGFSADKSSDFTNSALSCLRPLQLKTKTLPGGMVSYSFVFAMRVSYEGLYHLYFHNCAEHFGSPVNLNVTLNEENLHQNYLSAGKMPLPDLYFKMGILFFVAGCFWILVVRKRKREVGVTVFQIHYLMGALVFVKSLSLLLNSINYQFIQIEGAHDEGWIVLYYMTHMLKEVLLLITILLIGSGYEFVKPISNKDRTIFMIAVPLQVLSNVAQIMIEQSEEGEVAHTTWQVIFISVDLICCGALMFPIVWSIQHLQQASKKTDGNTASNLRKLRTFRYFYAIVVCYVYFTRIVVQMLFKITVPFQHDWLTDMLVEMFTFIFFVLTGYLFRPAIDVDLLSEIHLKTSTANSSQRLHEVYMRYGQRMMAAMKSSNDNNDKTIIGLQTDGKQ